MAGKIKKKNIIRIAVYLNETEMTIMAREAEKLKFRRLGIPIKKHPTKELSEDWVANGDGISRYLKYCHNYYIEHEAERTSKLADLLAREKALKEEKEKLGVL